MTRILPNWINGFLEMTEGMDIPPLYAEWTAISCISAALQRKCWTYAGRHYYHPGIYVILVGPSGCGKGTVMGQVRGLIGSQEQIKLSSSSLGGLGVYSCIADAKIKTTLSKYYTLNYVERNELVHCSLYAHIDEFRNFVGYGEFGMVEKLCNLYDTEDEIFTHTSLTGEAVEMPLPCLNILAGTVPGAFRDQKMLKAMTFDGLGSRCILVYGDYTGMDAVWDERSPKQERLVLDLRHDIDFLLMMNGPFDWTKDARDYYLTWQNKWRNNPFRLGKEYSGFISRARVHMAKLAMPICAARTGDNKIITVKDLEQIEDLLDRTCIEMPKIYENYGPNKNHAIMMDMVDYLKYNGPTKPLALRAAFSEYVGKRVFEEIVVDMLELGHARGQNDGNKKNRFLTYNENGR